MTTYSGNFRNHGGRIGIVVARFNNFVTTPLLAGARDGLTRHGVAEDLIDVVYVPGAFELPTIARQMAISDRYTGLIVVGAVIRGETSHYDYVCEAAANGVAAIGLETGVPTMFGVLTTDTVEQAVNRAGVKGGNKGTDCALSLLEMIDLQAQLKQA